MIVVTVGLVAVTTLGVLRLGAARLQADLRTLVEMLLATDPRA